MDYNPYTRYNRFKTINRAKLIVFVVTGIALVLFLSFLFNEVLEEKPVPPPAENVSDLEKIEDLEDMKQMYELYEKYKK